MVSQCQSIFFRMTKLKNILIEAIRKDQKVPDPRFTTYFISFIIKFKKSLNKNEVIERIRGIKNVTIVDVHKPKKFADWSRKSKDYEYNLVDIKFNTNLPPEEEIKKIEFAMLRSDNTKDVQFINGIVGVKAMYDTLVKLDIKGLSKRLKVKPI